MPHYICKGENCKTISDRPSVCLEPGCMKRYKLLHECECSNKENHIHVTRVPFIKYGSVKNKHEHTSKINPVSFGLSFGLLVGFYFFALGIFAAYFGVGENLVASLEVLYIGYDATLLGSIAGGLWGIVDGFIGGMIIAYIYNGVQKLRAR